MSHRQGRDESFSQQQLREKQQKRQRQSTGSEDGDTPKMGELVPGRQGEGDVLFDHVSNFLAQEKVPPAKAAAADAILPRSVLAGDSPSSSSDSDFSSDVSDTSDSEFEALSHTRGGSSRPGGGSSTTATSRRPDEPDGATMMRKRLEGLDAERSSAAEKTEALAILSKLFLKYSGDARMLGKVCEKYPAAVGVYFQYLMHAHTTPASSSTSTSTSTGTGALTADLSTSSAAAAKNRTDPMEVDSCGQHVAPPASTAKQSAAAAPAAEPPASGAGASSKPSTLTTAGGTGTVVDSRARSTGVPNRTRGSPAAPMSKSDFLQVQRLEEASASKKRARPKAAESTKADAGAGSDGADKENKMPRAAKLGSSSGQAPAVETGRSGGQGRAAAAADQGQAANGNGNAALFVSNFASMGRGGTPAIPREASGAKPMDVSSA